MRPERRFKPGMDGGLTAAVLVSPPHHLRTAVFLSKRWGPPQSFTIVMDLGLKSDHNMHGAHGGSFRVRIEARHRVVAATTFQKAGNRTDQ